MDWNNLSQDEVDKLFEDWFTGPNCEPRAHFHWWLSKKTNTLMELDRYQYKNGDVSYIRITGEDAIVYNN